MTAALRALPSEPSTRGVLSSIHPVGVQTPTAEMMLIGALLYASAADRIVVVANVHDDDLESPSSATVLKLIRGRVQAARAVDAVLLSDDLQRAGELVGNAGALLSKCLTDAVTCAASGEAVVSYAAAVVGESYRRRYESLGAALTELSASLPEHELLAYLVRAGSECRDHARRLTSLREASGATA